MHRLRTFLVLSLTLLAFPAFAATLNVGPGQTYTTIQSAIVAAKNGDTVLVYPGTYYENIDFLGKAITVTSTSGPTGGAANTIIDGGAIAPVVIFQSGELRNSILSNLTIRNGGAPPSTNPTPSGIFVNNSAPSITNNIITGNECDGLDVTFSAALISGNTISDTGGYDTGFCDLGSGITIRGTQSVGTSTHNEVIGNTIENNYVGYADGGGMTIWAGEGTTVIGNIFLANKGGEGGAVWAVNTEAMVFIDNLFYGNTATGTGFSDGGALSLLTGSSVGPFIGIISGNTFAGNLAPNGVADGETATDVLLQGGLAQYVFVNNIVYGTSASLPSVTCGTIYNSNSITPLVFDHNDIYNAAGGPGYGGACSDQTGTFGNISADPLFSNIVTGDFSLRSGSPAIDAGNNSAPQMQPDDIAGKIRIQDATAKGYPIVDMGAYEFTGLTDASPTILTLTPSEYFTSYNASSSPLTFTSTLASASGTPTGPVTIYVDGKVVITNNIGSSGTITFALPGLTPGLHAFTSTYPGSGIFPPAVSVKFYLLLPLFSTTLQLASVPNPSVFGNPVIFTLTASAMDGSVPSPITLTDTTTNTFLATLTPNSAGVATYTTSSLAIGYHTIQASYAGNSTHDSSSASVSQDVLNGYTTITALISSLNPSTVGQSVTFTATVTSSNGTPAGSVVFADGGTTLQSVSLSTSGVASFTTSALTVGTHPITAAYVPTGSFAGSTGSVLQVVNGLASTSILTASPTTAVYDGAPITLATTISPATPPGAGTPTGTVTFIVDGVSGTAQNISNGTATLNLTGLAGGPHTFGCKYSGDTNYSSSTCNSAAATITPAPTNFGGDVQPVPAYAFQPITFQAILNISSYLGGNGRPIPGPDSITITYGLAGGTPIIMSFATDANGTVNDTIASGLPPGNYIATYNFAGNANLQPSTASIPFVVVAVPTGTTLTASPNPGYQGQLITLTASVASSAGTPTGTVVFFDGGSQIGSSSVNSSGVAAFTISTLALGSHALTANFGPSFGSAFVASHSNTINEVILQSSFNLTLSSSSITIPAGKQGSTTLQLSSIGNFSGPLTLSFGALPQYATGSLSSSTVTLAAGSNTSSTFTLQTSALAANTVPSRPGSRTVPITLCTLLVLLPLALRKRNRMRSLLMLCATAVLFQALTGCTMIRIPFHLVASGSYQIPITATDANNNTQTQTLTVVVTP